MMKKAKRVVILGSTGSIGRQTLDIVRAFPDYFSVIALATGGNLDLLTEQVAEFQPDYINYAVPAGSIVDRDRFKKIGCSYLTLEEMAALPDADIVVVAVSGGIGLDAVMAAVKASKNIVLSNKESLVAAGSIITAAARKNMARIFPADSEHSAIWQCLAGEKQPPRRIILTASGGPFRGFTPEQLNNVTPEQALAHPSWRMGRKITIDSATLMNKGLEIIEARWLFNVPIEDITVLVHPQSIVHSMVEFIDGAVKAQLGVPDMRLPIQYAMNYPDRLENDAIPRINWTEFTDLKFEQPDPVKFPCLRLAIEAGKEGGTSPAVLCAADEIAVDLFLKGRIGFTGIPRLVEKVLNAHNNNTHPDIADIKEADRWAREKAQEIAGRKD
jgi:1-deoxy-D-xylulose-5-phosphate reductoisomerase